LALGHTGQTEASESEVDLKSIKKVC